ncbi:PadR family transcriptional regulator [Amycolatopsis acidicola]|uniref:PadR family transcriptional regulator n=1 Tax=Amycolatopsis acidicola TaxID=2596893 RepID=A0A5N0UIS9_9PSEU|nr:PadR family transcriptional regulator [Amycolatopsis acidicola]KAA9148783.1 PadR family transcriptional regulator [Amycolatopsis acidicola]
MAQRRKVGNLLALAVLSAVVQRPMHPYEMASILRERGKDKDMPIKWGSLYTVVGNLEKHGFLEAAESRREGGRPERTVYRITDAGRAELVDWARELVATPEPEQSRFQAGLSVLAIIPPTDVITLLRGRLDTLAGQLESQRKALTEAAAEIPRLFLIETEYELAIREAEAAWIKALLHELTEGTFPGLGQWQAFHDTGRLPPELTELAERGSEPR